MHRLRTKQNQGLLVFTSMSCRCWFCTSSGPNRMKGGSSSQACAQDYSLSSISKQSTVIAHHIMSDYVIVKLIKAQCTNLRSYWRVLSIQQRWSNRAFITWSDRGDWSAWCWSTHYWSAWCWSTRYWSAWCWSTNGNGLELLKVLLLLKWHLRLLLWLCKHYRLRSLGSWGLMEDCEVGQVGKLWDYISNLLHGLFSPFPWGWSGRSRGH